jgi:hypothetical protein
LGLIPHSVKDAVRDNADSLLAWSLMKMRKGVGNWQGEGNDLGIRSKWSPHLYPAIDPEVRRRIEAEAGA